MLGRKTYTAEEIAAGRRRVATQLEAHRALPAKAAATLEPVLFNNMVLVLDRLYVHRVRPVSGKDTNPVTEVELLAESLLAGDTFRANKVIKYVPEQAVLGLTDGTPIALTADQFATLADAFFAELETRFGEP